MYTEALRREQAHLVGQHETQARRQNGSHQAFGRR
jgi:hypothetical protein